MPLDDNALTTVATLRQWLTQDATADSTGRLSDSALEGLIGRATAAIEGYCERALLAPAEAETYVLDGTGGKRLILPEWPLLELVSLTIDEQAIPARAAVGEVGYMASAAEACLELTGFVFTQGTANVVAVARCGYDPALAETSRRHRQAVRDLEQACLHLCAAWFWEPVAGRTAVQQGGVAVDLEPEPWPAVVRGLLAPYRRLGG